MPRTQTRSDVLDSEKKIVPSLKRIFKIKRHREGVIAQFFYVGAQVMCWTFIIQYGTKISMDMGFSEIDAEVKSQQFNIYAMLLFCINRFICTLYRVVDLALLV